jgi:hypothetical protein
VPTVKQLEAQIRRIEGFRVVITHRDGRDVRGDKKRLRGYPYQNAASGSLTISEWRRLRFERNYPNGLRIEVPDRASSSWRRRHGGTLLDTVRHGGRRRLRRG